MKSIVTEVPDVITVSQPEKEAPGLTTTAVITIITTEAKARPLPLPSLLRNSTASGVAHDPNLLPARSKMSDRSKFIERIL